MQIVQKSKRVLSILIILALCFALITALTPSASAAELLPQELYMEQSRAGICTLTSAAMLIRSTLYMNGNSHWSTISESDAASACWIWGVGIKFDWSFETDYASITYAREVLNGISAEDLKKVLDEHPEGVEFYCGGVPHAFLLTDYEDDTFYCVDPAPYCSGRRVPIAESWNGYRLGGTQEAVLRNATAYWYVADCDVTADMDEIPLDAIRQSAAISDAKQLLMQDRAWVSTTLPLLNQ